MRLSPSCSAQRGGQFTGTLSFRFMQNSVSQIYTAVCITPRSQCGCRKLLTSPLAYAELEFPSARRICRILLKNSAPGGKMHPIAKKTIALSAMAAPMLGLMIVGGEFLLSPQSPAPQSWHLIASMSELPNDGTPVLLPVFEERFDAWTRLPDERVYDVCVRKEPSTTRVSVTPSWHHGDLRIPIRYDDRENKYVSVCWNVAFDMQGKEITTPGMKPIGFDLGMLPVKVNHNELWVCVDATTH
jgi:hypothetical protein